jgi:hypothetical protein
MAEELPSIQVNQRRPLRRQPEDHNFGSLIMLAATAGRRSAGDVGCQKGLFFFLQESPIR